jgi:sigma-B regulation protein RsbU (phosphoserine phosphatase)
VRAGWKSAAYSSPRRPLDWINLLATAFFEDRRFEEFVTMCTGRLEVPTGRVELISAGHVWPVVIRDRAEVVQMIPGPPLGVDLPRDWRVTDIHLDEGDALFVFTDGLTESRVTGRSGQRWGEEGLIRWMNGKLNRDRNWRPDLDELLRHFADNGTFADDVAVMLIQTPTKPASSKVAGSGAAAAGGSTPDAGARVSAASPVSFPNIDG